MTRRRGDGETRRTEVWAPALVWLSFVSVVPLVVGDFRQESRLEIGVLTNQDAKERCDSNPELQWPCVVGWDERLRESKRLPRRVQARDDERAVQGQSLGQGARSRD